MIQAIFEDTFELTCLAAFLAMIFTVAISIG